MATGTQATKGATISVRNVGGINETSVQLEAGVNVLAGRNATNRTSLLQAIMAALGSENVTIKGDADEGEVTLTIGEETYQRRLRRRNGTVVFDGDGYLRDTELADLFAFLLDTNEARQAVTTSQDLRDVIMRPVDIEELQAEIVRLESEKDDIDDQLETIEAHKQRLPDLEAKKTRLKDEIDETREALKAKEREIDETDADVGTKQAQQQQLEEKLDALTDARNTLEDVRYEIDSERAAVESLEEERATFEAELDELPETPDDERETLEAEIDRLRERRRRLDSEINALQSTIKFNEEMLEDKQSEVYETMVDDGHATDELLDEDVVCWTCGSTVSREQIDSTLDQLRDLRREKLDRKQTLSDQLEESTDEKERLDRQRTQRADHERRLDEIEDELARRNDRIADLQERRDETEQRVSELEDTVEDHEPEQFDGILDLHREANDLEYELGRLETDLEDVTDEIEDVEDRIDEQSELETEREQIADELTDLRTRVETLEEEAIEAFNDHMAEVLGTLEYDNLERIWIERVQKEVTNGRRTTVEPSFELHVIRTTPSGTTYEDTVEHLSESEREVTGLVFALAGYLVHEVYETVPFILLDSLEAIDADRIADLVEYFGEFADHLVVALLEEDADAVGGDHNRIESI